MRDLQDPESFAALLGRVRLGDQDAASELVRGYEGIVRRSVRSRLGQQLRPALDSMDVVQSIHRSLLIGVRHDKFAFHRPEDLVALALVMVRRKIARHWRRARKRPAVSGRIGPCSGSETSTPGFDPPGRDAAEGAVEANDALERFLAEVDEIDRQLIRLRLEGHSTADVARALGLDPPFLRVRLGRMRKKLRERGLLDSWF